MLGAGRDATGSPVDSTDAALGRVTENCQLGTAAARSALRARIAALRPEIGRQAEQGLCALLDNAALDGERLRDQLSTRLMEVFRTRASRGAFSLLYEITSPHLLMQVAATLRRFASGSDPRDVLQEVFFNVYRYPHRFSAERDDAFRAWSAMIVRNTVLKHLRSQGRSSRTEVPFEDLSEYAQPRTSSPEGSAMEFEDARSCGRVYVTYLHLYLRFYSMLSERERAAIRLVEVDEVSYKDAASQLGIKLENLKMVIFRARRKIQRAMGRVFEQQPVDLRPAREGRIEGPAAASLRLSPTDSAKPASIHMPCKSSVKPVTGTASSTTSEGANPV